MYLTPLYQLRLLGSHKKEKQVREEEVGLCQEETSPSLFLFERVVLKQKIKLKQFSKTFS